MFKYKQYDIRDVVNNREWQNIRKSLLNSWKITPVKNVHILKKYLNLGSGKKQLRALRVYNYLTGSAFRIGIIQHKEIDRLKKEVKKFI